jgi:hypothetical protein
VTGRCDGSATAVRPERIHVTERGKRLARCILSHRTLVVRAGSVRLPAHKATTFHLK